ncbi:MAG: YncE family protein [Cyanobacteria bacterium]|nr:YncE family protein [Cyanobacteriota bacterium]
MFGQYSHNFERWKMPFMQTNLLSLSSKAFQKLVTQQLSSFPTRNLPFSLLGLALIFLQSLANATELPPAVLSYLRTKDAQVEIRFDGLVTYSNGIRYLPILPQDPTNKMDKATKVVSTIPDQPDQAIYPDLIEFDNGLFLIRLVPTNTGKVTLARMDSYPIRMKEGLLPQDLVMPANLFIPAELKVVLGSLPYNPKESLVVQPKKPDKTKADLPKEDPNAVPKTVFFSNLSVNNLISIDPDKSSVQGKIPFNCVPSSLTTSPDQKLMFATCLTTDELVVVDTEANLIKTRIPVGSKPSSSLYVEKTGEIYVTNRYSNFINVIQASDLSTSEETISIPSSGGGMLAYQPTSNMLYVSDNSAGKSGSIFEIDLETKTLKRTFKVPPSVSGMFIPPYSKQLWVSSRVKNTISVIDITTGTITSTFNVGKKPVSLTGTYDFVYSVSAEEDRIDAIKLDNTKWVDHTVLEPIILPGGSFASSMVISNDLKYGYVVAAGAESLYVIDLKNQQLFKSIPVQNKGTILAVIGGEKGEIPAPPPEEALEQNLPPLNPLAGNTPDKHHPEKEVLEKNSLGSKFNSSKLKFWGKKPDSPETKQTAPESSSTTPSETKILDKKNSYQLTPVEENQKLPVLKGFNLKGFNLFQKKEEAKKPNLQAIPETLEGPIH